MGDCALRRMLHTIFTMTTQSQIGFLLPQLCKKQSAFDFDQSSKDGLVREGVTKP